MATISTMSMLKPKTITIHSANSPTTKPTSLPRSSRSISLANGLALPTPPSLTAAAAAGAIFSALSYSDAAFAAQQIAELAAEGDNRGLALLLPIAPAIAWVLFNILQPALNQLNRMRTEKGLVVGLGLGGGLAAAELIMSTPSASAGEIAAIADAAPGDNRGLLLLFVVAPAIAWVLYNILQPALNQLNRMSADPSITLKLDDPNSIITIRSNVSSGLNQITIDSLLRDWWMSSRDVHLNHVTWSATADGIRITSLDLLFVSPNRVHPPVRQPPRQHPPIRKSRSLALFLSSLNSSSCIILAVILSNSSMRRSRSKARKPRYVSLRRHLAPPLPPPADPSDMSSSAAAASDNGAEQGVARRRLQLDLFPLHPEHLDRDPHVACLLDDRGGVGQPTLAAILGGGGASSSSTGSPSPASLASPSVNWEEEEEHSRGDDGLARRALRGRERWAYCCNSSGAPAASSSSEEVASSAAAGGGVDLWRCAAVTQALALKLDYEEILAAWSDRGPLYLDGDGPQVVPQLLHHVDPYDNSTAFPVLVEVGQGDAASTWNVPEKAWDGEGNEAEAKKESSSSSSGGGGTMSREERVKRYKEKRSNRLFAKRIRYEVRKMNAEKRPRVKGRFVRRNGEDEDQS
ncbi:hypothetical protein Cni_G05295 [Canna indica]|uniref:CCT domain-containing protein n=1 Tax=Canna indica TaxID=4628 RepID=A0AAQ3JU99_9LILI|nr:hypothetical protein Cni_G05295 [Canna indica]